MKARTVTLAELGLIAGTRAALGAGVALLFADRLEPAQRRAVGWTLFAVGAITTIPLLAGVLSRGGRGEDAARLGGAPATGMPEVATSSP